MSSEPPEEPHYRNDFSLLSPASPRPIHFPTPTNIPVLEMQHDVGFNQTEPHMNDPASRNTDVRPDLWRDPSEQQSEQSEQQQDYGGEVQDTTMDHMTPYSTGAEDVMAMESDTNEHGGVAIPAEQQAHSAGSASTDADAILIPPQVLEPEPNQLSSSSYDPANDQAQVAEGAPLATLNAPEPSSDPSAPTADATSACFAQEPVSQSDDQAQSSAATLPAFDPNAVDVQALLDTLQTAPSTAPTAAANTAPQADSMTVPTTDSPSLANHTLQDVSSLSSPLTASALGAPPSGLPPRPPPQEQPLIHPNYVHSQHIRDYHPHAANPAFQPHAKSGSQGNAADPTGRNYVPPVHSPTSANAGDPVQQQPSNPYATITPIYSNGQAAPTSLSGSAPFAGSPSANSAIAMSTYAYPTNHGLTGTSVDVHGDSNMNGVEQARNEDRPWDAGVQRKYDNFIEEERKYVSEGRWEQFPNGARLFVGKSNIISPFVIFRKAQCGRRQRGERRDQVAGMGVGLLRF